MSPENSKKVAYASQHTDDAKYEHALSFENGGRFQQVLSAHRFLHPDVFSLDSQYKIYVPFHFIPGNQGKRFQERMVCRENSETAQKMVREVSNLEGKPYQLHRLGIALHVYADTWSHQDFSGLQTEVNDVEEIDVRNEKKAGIAGIFTGFFREVAESVLPQIGHTEAASLPDESYRDWSFYHVYQKRSISIKNWLRCQSASRAIYEEIKEFLAKNQKFREGEPVAWSHIRSSITHLFKQKGDLEKRCRSWAERITASGFGFPCESGERDIGYDDREWFRAAVEVKTVDETEQYVRKDSFHVSDWKYFHDAAESHRLFIFQELLSPEEIICG